MEGSYGMTLERTVARAFRMSEETWARHANPWSVWTRFTALPALILAFWSRAWIGPASIAAIAAAVLWTWLNPRIFDVPETTDRWASKGVLGERVWLNRDEIPVPPHHRVVPNILNAAAALGAVITVWGVATLAVWPTVLGALLIYSGKLWYLDRMVWLYEDMKDATPRYRSWLY